MKLALSSNKALQPTSLPPLRGVKAAADFGVRLPDGEHLVRLSIKHSALIAFFAFAVGAGALCHAQGNPFAKLDFGGNTHIEVPRNWTYLDDNLRKHLNTGSDAATRLAGITPNPGENVILVAANAYTSFRTPSATLRLSIRRSDGPTQADMREVSRLPKVELAQLLAPVADETRRVMIGIDGVKRVKAIDARVVTNQGMICMFFEFETEASDSVKLSQTYVCPLGNRSVKLSTSYRKSEGTLFRPVIEYVWQSLRVK